MKKFVMPTMILMLLVGVFGLSAAHAEITTSVDDIMTTYQTQSGSWQSALIAIAKSLFWKLALIEFSWAAISLAFKQASFDEWVAMLVNQIMFIGFFFWLLTHSVEYSQAIIDSFKLAATNSGATASMPSQVFNQGVAVVNKIFEATSIWHPADSVGMLIASIIIIVVFAILTAELILVNVQAYVVIAAGVLFMGFGGSRWTKDFAINTIKNCLAVGAKLFMLQLLIGMGITFLSQWAEQFDATKNIDITLMVGASIVLLALSRTIPEMVSGMINGTGVAGSGALAGAAAAVGGAAGAFAGGMASAGMAAGGAAKLASAQLNASPLGQSQSSMLGKAMQGASFASNMASNLAKSTASDIGGQLSGANNHGHMGARMGSSMMDAAKSMNKESEAKGGFGSSSGASKPSAENPFSAGGGNNGGDGGSGSGNNSGGNAPNTIE